MGTLRKLRRKREKRVVGAAIGVYREHGPMSAALLEFIGHVVDPATLDEKQLRCVLTLATAAWNAAFSPADIEELRALLGVKLGEYADEMQATFDHLVEVRRVHFGDDRRVVMEHGHPVFKRKTSRGGDERAAVTEL